jgi:FkbM family methyltransferase
LSHLLSKTTLIRRARLRELKERENAYYDLDFIKAMDPDKIGRCVGLLGASRSQIRQDIFVLAELDFKQDGYFVEFGATNGVELNNTLMMEAEFGWTGILAEPAAGWHADLRKNRKAVIDTRVVWKDSGEVVKFTETASAINSSISSFVKTSRKMRGKTYDVETVSLNDLLEQHNAPAVIDYISIDTEGSEFDILSTVDFDRWSFRVMTVEHNHEEPRRQEVCDLLTAKGYTRVRKAVSRFDDWYVKAG